MSPLFLVLATLHAFAPAAERQAGWEQEPAIPPLVSTEWLAARLEDRSVVVIQVDRDPESYRAGHIPGARLLSLRDLVTTRNGIPNEVPPLPDLVGRLEAAGISSDSRVVVTGDPLGSARLFFTLDYLGLGGQVALLDGGMAKWKAEGRSLTEEEPPLAQGRLVPTLRPELLVDADWIAARLGDPGLLLLDARPGPEYEGRPPGEGIARGGHIPGARSFFWRLALTAPEPAVLKEPPVLRKLLGRLGLAAGKDVVVYCRTGVQASHLYFVLRSLGYAPRLYDGSFIDWSARASLPVEGGAAVLR